MFAHTRLPYTLPIPKDILEYMYGENHEVYDSHLFDPYSFNEYNQQIICPI